MKTATNLLQIGLFLLLAISTGCLSTGERQRHPPLQATTLSTDVDASFPSATVKTMSPQLGQR